MSTEENAARAFLNIVYSGRDYNWNDEHFKRTPERFLKMLRDLCTPEAFDFTVFHSTADEMIIVKEIDFVSLCAHHIIPFIGKVHVAYVPDGTICGLSKIVRLVKAHAATLCVQEELTNSIANDLYSRLTPKGVAVIMEAEHLCMTIRGVQAPGTKTITSSMTGVFSDHSRQARNEFLQLIGRNHG